MISGKWRKGGKGTGGILIHAAAAGGEERPAERKIKEEGEAGRYRDWYHHQEECPSLLLSLQLGRSVLKEELVKPFGA